MSDAVLINLITNITSVILGLIGIVVVVKTKKEVKGYHVEVNGNMKELLETTKQLAIAQEKLRAAKENDSIR